MSESLAVLPTQPAWTRLSLSFLRSPWQDMPVAFDMPPARVHSNTLAALALCVPLTTMPLPRCLHIYTDGSAKGSDTGWAVAITQWDPCLEAIAIVGALGGVVITDPARADFVGACEKTSRAAELSAIVWALLWIIAHWEVVPCDKVTIHFDSTTAGFAASGDWNADTDAIALKARHLAQAAEACFGQQRLLWAHVPAHCGQPWNELADTIADCIRMQLPFKILQPCLPGPVALGAFDTSRLHLLPTGPDSLAFPSIRNGVANWHELSSPLTVMRPEQIVPFQVHSHVQVWTFHCTCLSANLQSAAGKFAYLEQQLEAEAVSLAFFQETKTVATPSPLGFFGMPVMRTSIGVQLCGSLGISRLAGSAASLFLWTRLASVFSIVAQGTSFSLLSFVASLYISVQLTSRARAGRRRRDLNYRLC